MKNRNEELSSLRSDMDIRTVIGEVVGWNTYFTHLKDLGSLSRELWDNRDITTAGIYVNTPEHRLAVKYERQGSQRSFIVMDSVWTTQAYISQTIGKILSWLSDIDGFKNQIRFFQNPCSRLKSSNGCRIMAITDITRMMVDGSLSDKLLEKPYHIKEQMIAGISVADYELPPEFMEYTQYIGEELWDYRERMHVWDVSTYVLAETVKKHSIQVKDDKVHNKYNDLFHRQYSNIVIQLRYSEDRKDSKFSGPYTVAPKTPSMSRYGMWDEDMIMAPLLPRPGIKATEATPLLSKHKKEKENGWSSCFSWCC